MAVNIVEPITLFNNSYNHSPKHLSPTTTTSNSFTNDRGGDFTPSKYSSSRSHSNKSSLDGWDILWVSVHEIFEFVWPYQWKTYRPELFIHNNVLRISTPPSVALWCDDHLAAATRKFQYINRLGELIATMQQLVLAQGFLFILDLSNFPSRGHIDLYFNPSTTPVFPAMRYITPQAKHTNDILASLTDLMQARGVTLHWEIQPWHARPVAKWLRIHRQQFRKGTCQWGLDRTVPVQWVAVKDIRSDNSQKILRRYLVQPLLAATRWTTGSTWKRVAIHIELWSCRSLLNSRWAVPVNSHLDATGLLRQRILLEFLFLYVDQLGARLVGEWCFPQLAKIPPRARRDSLKKMRLAALERTGREKWLSVNPTATVTRRSQFRPTRTNRALTWARHWLTSFRAKKNTQAREDDEQKKTLHQHLIFRGVLLMPV